MKQDRPSSAETPSSPGYMPSPDQYLATLEGDGSAAGRSEGLRPPAVRPPGKGGGRTKRGVMLALVALVIVVAGYAGYIIYNVAHISAHPGDISMLAGKEADRVNVLVLGEGDPGHSGQGLTDTMMLISLDLRTHRSAQISIPRDLRAQIPGFGYNKINQANALGGPQLASETVAGALGVPVDYYVLTNFTGLKDLVDAVGGIDVDVKTALIDREYPCDDNQYKVCGLDIEPGLQHMNGTVALEYTRCRKGTCGDDFGRAARQQEVIDLVRAKATSLPTVLNPVKVAAITTALRSSLTTTMGPLGMAQFAYALSQSQRNAPVHLVLSTSNYLVSAGGSSDLVPRGGSFATLDERIQNIFSDPIAASDTPRP